MRVERTQAQAFEYLKNARTHATLQLETTKGWKPGLKQKQSPELVSSVMDTACNQVIMVKLTSEPAGRSGTCCRMLHAGVSSTTSFLKN